MALWDAKFKLHKAFYLIHKICVLQKATNWIFRKKFFNAAEELKRR